MAKYLLCYTSGPKQGGAQWARAFSTMGGSSLNMEFGLSGGIKKYFKFDPGGLS